MRVLKITMVMAAMLPLVLRAAAHAGSGAAFLKMDVGARAAGLGSAFTALADDASSLHWNPAGLAGASRKEVFMAHTELFQGMRHEFLGYAQPVGRAAFGVGATYLGHVELQGRGEQRQRAAGFGASDLAVTLGWARAVYGNLALGAGVKFLRSRIGGVSAQGFAVDLGVRTRTVPLRIGTLSLGLAARNMGPRMRFSQQSYALPLTLAAGGGFHIARGLLIAGELRYLPEDSRAAFNTGVEFAPVSLLALRAGYIARLLRAGSAAASPETLPGFALGLGLKLSRAAIDYAFTPAGELGQSQRVSLALKF